LRKESVGGPPDALSGGRGGHQREKMYPKKKGENEFEPRPGTFIRENQKNLQTQVVCARGACSKSRGESSKNVVSMESQGKGD